MASQTPLYPAFKGHAATTWDALLLFKSCLQGHINHLILSGNIFIYEEYAFGIKRWTDGISWSPSRIVGNFLIYRELNKPFPPGEKKRALKRKRASQGVKKANSQSNSSVGLVKKTITITFQGVPHHLVSYYRIEDVDNNSLLTPSGSPFFYSVPGITVATPLSTYSSRLDRTWLEDDYIQAQQPRKLGLGSSSNFIVTCSTANHSTQLYHQQLHHQQMQRQQMQQQ
ncbi:Gti1/Pac2 family domain-containing protein [Trichoderma barbatum]